MDVLLSTLSDSIEILDLQSFKQILLVLNLQLQNQYPSMPTFNSRGELILNLDHILKDNLTKKIYNCF